MSVYIGEIDDYIEPLSLFVGIISQTTMCTAILNLGADVNVMSKATYQALGEQTLHLFDIVFSSFTKFTSSYINTISTTLYLEGCREVYMFYISNMVDSAHDIILGPKWMDKHLCTIDWDTKHSSLNMGPSHLRIPLVQKKPSLPLKVPTSQH